MIALDAALAADSTALEQLSQLFDALREFDVGATAWGDFWLGRLDAIENGLWFAICLRAASEGSVFIPW